VSERSAPPSLDDAGTDEATSSGTTAPRASGPTRLRSSRGGRIALGVTIAVLVAAMPVLLDSFWVQTGLFAMAAAIGAIGLTLLVGRAGQLSLGHAFFGALGAYSYTIASGEVGGNGGFGLGLPPVLALLLAGVVPAVAGFLLGPISGRLRGIYLGLATIGLVFLAQHVLLNAEALTGGYNGRSVADLSLFGFHFANSSPDDLVLFGFVIDGLRRLWFVFALLLAVAWWAARNIARGRTGRAFLMVRDDEVAAAAMGINVMWTKATAFTVSSTFAGVGGALTALAFGRVAPDVFDLQASIDFLVMIVIGGLGSIGGAVAGAVFVVALPLILAQYSDILPGLASPGSEGYDAATAARLAYGAAIIVVLLFVRGGLAGGVARILRRTGSSPPDKHAPSALHH
jgi:branched-chain amino acid transport system permease protein